MKSIATGVLICSLQVNSLEAEHLPDMIKFVEFTAKFGKSYTSLSHHTSKFETF